MIPLYKGERLLLTLVFPEGSPTGSGRIACRAVEATPMGIFVSDIEGMKEDLIPGRESIPAPQAPRLLMLHTIANIEFLDRAQPDRAPWEQGAGRGVPQGLPAWDGAGRESAPRTFYCNRTDRVEFVGDVDQAALPRPDWRGDGGNRDFVPEEKVTSDECTSVRVETGTRTPAAEPTRHSSPERSGVRDAHRQFRQDYLFPELKKMSDRMAGG